jgi:hypothetical protein
MATRAPRLSPIRLFFEPIQGPALFATGILIWLAGAAYCHGYQYLMERETIGSWSGSLTWSAVAVLPWFALFEWSKQPQGAETTRRPMLLLALIAGIATGSIALEYLVNFCVDAVSDHLGLLFMRRLPAIGVTVLLIALTRKAMLRRPPAPTASELTGLAPSVDWIEAADNYVEIHIGERVMLVRMTLAAAEELLRSRGFVRIHRRYLVNARRIHEIVGSNGDRRVRVAGQDLPVGSRFAASLSTRLDRAGSTATT